MPWPIRHVVLPIPSVRIVRRVLVQPPPRWPDDARPQAVLRFLDRSTECLPKDEADEELKRRIQAASDALPWPDAVLVGSNCKDYDTAVADPLTWCVAVTKTTGKIFLLHRQPRLERLRNSNPMVFYFPERRRTG